jgi:ankyrin repeat protein
MTASQELSQELIQEFVIAAHNDFPKVQRMLDENPGLLNTVDPQGKETALAAASHIGDTEIVEYLLSKGAPMTICTAAMLGMTDRVAAFLDADPSLAQTPGSHGLSPMVHAAIGGKTEIADLLLAHGGDQRMDDALIRTALFNHPEMAAWLLDHGANINARSPIFKDKTPLAIAVQLKHDQLADMLRERGGEE